MQRYILSLEFEKDSVVGFGLCKGYFEFEHYSIYGIIVYMERIKFHLQNNGEPINLGDVSLNL